MAKKKILFLVWFTVLLIVFYNLNIYPQKSKKQIYTLLDFSKFPKWNEMAYEAVYPVVKIVPLEESKGKYALNIKSFKANSENSVANIKFEIKIPESIKDIPPKFLTLNLKGDGSKNSFGISFETKDRKKAYWVEVTVENKNWKEIKIKLDSIKNSENNKDTLLNNLNNINYLILVVGHAKQDYSFLIQDIKLE